MRNLIPTIVLVIACGPSTNDQAPTTVATAPSGPTYAVQFHRPPAIGRSYRVTTTTRNRQAQTFTQDGTEPQSQVDETLVELVGVMQRTGELTYWVEIESLQVTLGESVQRPLSAGTRVEVTRGDPGVIAMDGEPITGDLETWIGLVIPDGPPRNDDEYYGTRDPQPIGGTWNFQPEVVSELLQRMHVQVPAEAIHGGFQLVQHEPEPIDAIRVRGLLEMDTLDFPQMPDATVESGDVRIAMEWVLPTAADAVSPFRSMEMAMNAVIRLQDPETGESGVLTMEFRNHREATLSPM